VLRAPATGAAHGLMIALILDGSKIAQINAAIQPITVQPNSKFIPKITPKLLASRFSNQGWQEVEDGDQR